MTQKNKNNKISKKCKCNQHFYIPLPSLTIPPKNEQITPLDWFTPGTVQVKTKQCPPTFKYTTYYY